MEIILDSRLIYFRSYGNRPDIGMSISGKWTYNSVYSTLWLVLDDYLFRTDQETPEKHTLAISGGWRILTSNLIN